jgi:hypothetical protein
MNASWKAVLAFIAVFVAGTIFGGGFALRVSKQVAPHEGPRRIVQPLPRLQGQPPLGTQLLRRFVENLDLTNEQRDKLKPMVIHAEEQIAQLRQQSLEETETILRGVQQEFRAELTPEQQRKLNRMQQRQNELVNEERQRRQQQQKLYGQASPRPKQRAKGPQRPLNNPTPGPLQPQPQNQGAPQYSAPPGPPSPDTPQPLPRNP